MVGARHLDHGGRLYVDFWDNKQPGIYLFYWLAGRLFGFHEAGVHSLELIWHSLLAVAMVVGLRRHFERPWLAAAVPMATLGLFYGMCSKWHLTQVEILVTLPLFGCWWFSSQLDDAGKATHFRRWFLSGLCAGLMVTFKLALAPLALAIWTVAIGVRIHALGRASLRDVFSGLLAAFLGGVTFLAFVAAGFAFHGSLKEMVWTTFVYPLEALSKSEAAPLSRLLSSVAWFTANGLICILFAMLGLFSWRGARREALTPSLTAWLIAAAGVIWIQRWSWWQYHFCLFLIPLGILAVRGVDALLPNELLRNRRAADIAAACVLALCLIGPVIPSVGLKSLAFAQQIQKRTSWRHEYQRAIDPAEQKIWESTQFLRDEPAKAPIYVFGNPLYLYLSDRLQAMPEHGWSWETFLPSQWAALPEKLRAAKPVWLFADPNYADLINRKSPATRQVITDLYTPKIVTEEGVWFRLKEAVSPTK